MPKAVHRAGRDPDGAKWNVPHPCPLAMVSEVLPVQLSDSTLLEGSNPRPAASASESYIIT